MASEVEVAELIQLGHDITSVKLYLVSVTALWTYDYFLTLKDEIRYAWRTEGVLIFSLFLLIRYLPPLYQTWVVVAFFYPGYTPKMCGKSGFIFPLYYTFIPAFAQIVLTQRAYAITKKNKRVAAILYTISATQFCVVFYGFVHVALHPDSYHMCFTETQKVYTIIQMVFPLTFDIAVFVLVVVYTRIIRSMHPGMGMPKILHTVTRDAEIYFAIITVSHLLIVVMYTTARPGIGYIHGIGTAVLVPMMVTRMIISLKKAASSQQQPHVSMELPSTSPLHFSSSRPIDTIQLSVLRGLQA